MNTLLMIYPVALIAVLLYGTKLYKTGEFNEDYLSLFQTKAIRAAAAIGVILHHVTQIVTDYGYSNRGPITVFANLGILFTAIFFFCSGCGLLTSYYSRENYLDGFLLHRLSSVLIPFFVINILYVVYTCITSGRIIEGGKILRYIFGIYLINGNGWFIIEIFFLYLAFYILFRFLKNKDVALAALCVFAFALIIWTKSRGHEDPALNSNFNWFMGEWWYNSTAVFVMGLMFARYKDKITSFLKRKYTPLLIVTTILFGLFFVVEEVVRIRFGYYNPVNGFDFIGNETLTCIAQNILCVISTFFVILLGLKIKIGNKVLSFLSFECTELFLCHGMFVTIFTEKLKINIFWKYALVIACALMLAFPLAKLDEILLKSIVKLKKTFNLKNFSKEGRFSGLICDKKGQRTALIAAVPALILVCVVGQKTVRSLEFGKELSSIASSSQGDIVKFGRYDTDISLGKEQLEWIVVSIENGRYTLVTKYAIAGAAYNQSHKEVTWNDCDLRKRLNSKEFTDIFSGKEKSILLKNEDGDIISLLTAEEAAAFFESDLSRQLTATKKAKAKNVNVNDRSKVNYWDYEDNKGSWWWLRGDETPELTAPIVNYEGEIVKDEKYVNKPNGAIRPVIVVEIKR